MADDERGVVASIHACVAVILVDVYSKVHCKYIMTWLSPVDTSVRAASRSYTSAVAPNMFYEHLTPGYYRDVWAIGQLPAVRQGRQQRRPLVRYKHAVFI